VDVSVVAFEGLDVVSDHRPLTMAGAAETCSVLGVRGQREIAVSRYRHTDVAAGVSQISVFELARDEASVLARDHVEAGQDVAFFAVDAYLLQIGRVEVYGFDVARRVQADTPQRPRILQ